MRTSENRRKGQTCEYCGHVGADVKVEEVPIGDRMEKHRVCPTCQTTLNEYSHMAGSQETTEGRLRRTQHETGERRIAREHPKEPGRRAYWRERWRKPEESAKAVERQRTPVQAQKKRERTAKWEKDNRDVYNRRQRERYHRRQEENRRKHGQQ